MSRYKQSLWWTEYLKYDGIYVSQEGKVVMHIFYYMYSSFSQVGHSEIYNCMMYDSERMFAWTL